jgi:hypothetical protein
MPDSAHCALDPARFDVMPRRLYVLALTVIGLLIGGSAAVATYRALTKPPAAVITMADFERQIRADLRQHGDGYRAIIGDSISAVSPDQLVCGRPVLRVAYGGAQIDDALDTLMPLLANSRPAALLIAIGVNDAQRRIAKSREQLLADVAAGYRTLLQQAKALTPNVAVIEASPVGQGQPMGDVFFDPSLITAINELIRSAAADAKVPVFSLSALAKSDGFARDGVTLDGVHLSPDGYAIWNKVSAQAWQSFGACG